MQCGISTLEFKDDTIVSISKGKEIPSQYRNKKAIFISVYLIRVRTNNKCWGYHGGPLSNNIKLKKAAVLFGSDRL